MTTKQETVRPEEQLVGILEQLYLQLENFPAISTFVKGHRITSGTLFLPQTLQLVDGELNRNPSFLYECMELLDIMAVFSLSVYGDPTIYSNKLIDAIIQNRTTEDFEQTLGEGTTTHIVILDGDKMDTFLLSNKYLIALYIYTVISVITYNR